jgi:hypothetical protein
MKSLMMLRLVAPFAGLLLVPVLAVAQGFGGMNRGGQGFGNQNFGGQGFGAGQGVAGQNFAEPSFNLNSQNFTPTYSNGTFRYANTLAAPFTNVSQPLGSSASARGTTGGGVGGQTGGFGQTGGQRMGQTGFGQTGLGGQTGFGQTGFGGTAFGGSAFGPTGFGQTGLTGQRMGQMGLGQTGMGQQGRQRMNQGMRMGQGNQAGATTSPLFPTLIIGPVLRPTATPLSTNELTTRLQAQLRASPTLASARNLVLGMEGGVLVLRGEVVSENDRDLAEALVRLEPGIYDVRNELTLAP